MQARQELNATTTYMYCWDKWLDSMETMVLEQRTVVYRRRWELGYTYEPYTPTPEIELHRQLMITALKAQEDHLLQVVNKIEEIRNMFADTDGSVAGPWPPLPKFPSKFLRH